MTGVTETKDEIILKQEIQYFLNIRKKGHRYERSAGDQISASIKNIVNSPPSEYVFNESIMIVLIESGYIQ